MKNYLIFYRKRLISKKVTRTEIKEKKILYVRKGQGLLGYQIHERYVHKQ